MIIRHIVLSVYYEISTRAIRVLTLEEGFTPPSPFRSELGMDFPPTFRGLGSQSSEHSSLVTFP